LLCASPTLNPPAALRDRERARSKQPAEKPAEEPQSELKPTAAAVETVETAEAMEVDAPEAGDKPQLEEMVEQ
jgi:hypothetical protein